MKKCRKQRGALTIEASISYSIFMMIVVTFLYIMRIVYAYGLIQHAVAQTAKELSMYSYLYQVTGMNDAYQDIKNSTSGRKDQFNTDAGEIVKLYENLQSGNYGELEYNGTLNPKDILKNIGSAMLSEASDEANTQLLTLVARPMMAGYIGADSSEQSADSRLQALRVVGGLNGIDLNSSSLFEDGVTIDLVACYMIDPILPLDIVPELNFSNRAYVRGMSGKTAFQRKESENKKEQSVWDMESDVKRGTEIQKQQNVRNLPDKFFVFSAFDSVSGKATAEQSIDLREKTYQSVSGIKGAINRKCSKIENYKTTTYDGVTVDAGAIKSRELIIYIPSSTKDRKIDRSMYDEVVKEVQKNHPDIKIITKELD